MSYKQTILVTAAAGHIGTELIPLLLKEQVKLILPTTNADRLRSSIFASGAPGDNVAIEEGSISNSQWLEGLLVKHHVDTVFLNLIGTDELMITLNVLDSMRKVGGIKHVVYVSACGDFADTAEGFRKTVTLHNAAHVLVKPLIEYKLLTDKTYPWTTTRLGPTLFYVNDLRRQHRTVDGFYDEPISNVPGKGVSRVSCEDIALISRNSLLDGERWAGKKIMIGSLKLYSVSEIVALWSKVLGKEVKTLDGEEMWKQYEETEIGINKSYAWSRDLRLMYEAFAEDGFGMTEEEYKLQVECLGREPRKYEDWVAMTGKKLVK